MNRTQLAGMAVVAALAAQGSLGAPQGPRASDALKQLARPSLRFEPNTGRYDPRVRFMARSSGSTLFITDSGVTMVLPGKAQARDDRALPGPEPVKRGPGHVLRMRLVGAGKPTAVAGLQKTQHEVNYFIGRNPKLWRTHVPTFKQARFAGIYPGTDLVYYGNNGKLEYDFMVRPGADPGKVRLAFDGASSLRVASNGDLVAGTTVGDVHLQRPYAYQMVDGKRVQVACNYSLGREPRQVSFRTARYDTTRPLVVDPTMDLGTYLGGSGTDYAYGCALTSAGNVVATGFVSTANLPTTVGAVQESGNGGQEGFVAMIPASGVGASFSTYLGGSGTDNLYRCAVDASDAIYVVGRSNSTDFPTTTGAFQTLIGGGYDHTVSKLSADGSSLVYSTYIGGTGNEASASTASIIVDAYGQAICGLSAGNSTFPVTSGVAQTSLSGGVDAAITILNAAGSGLVASTYWGGGGTETPTAVALGAGGDIYLGGYTTSTNFPCTPGAFRSTRTSSPSGFVARFPADLSSCVFSTYVNAPSGTSTDRVSALLPNSDGSVYIGGLTWSSNFPVTSGAFQTTYQFNSEGFVGKLSADGTAMPIATYISSTGADAVIGLARSPAGDIVVTGYCGNSVGLTASAYAIKTTCSNDLLVVVLDPNLSTARYLTFIGGSPIEQATDACLRNGALAIAAQSSGNGSPTTLDAFQTSSSGGYDGYLVRLSMAQTSGTLTTTDASGAPGGTATLTASFTLADRYLPNKTLEFTVDGNVVGTAVTNSLGNASLSYSIPVTTTAGDHPVGVSFAGEAYLASASASAELVVSQPPALTSLVAANTSGEIDSSVDLVATLTASGSGVSNKAISFSIDGVAVGSNTTDATGVATVSYTIPSGTTAGDHAITASFAGDTNYQANSGSGTLTVDKIPTSLTVSDGFGIPSMETTLSATLKSHGVALSGMEVSFTVAGTAAGTALTDTNGLAQIDYTLPGNLLVGNKTIAASYAGDSDHLSCTGSGVLSVDTIATELTASAPVDLSISAYETVSATLVETSNGAGITGKTISFSLGSTSIGSATTDEFGVATLVFMVPNSLSPSTVSLNASFAGTAAYSDAYASTSTAVVDHGATGGFAAPAAGKRGDRVKLYCYVYRSVPPRDMLAGKSIIITVDGTQVGSATTDRNGLASISWTIPTSISLGTHTIAYAFAGDSHYDAWVDTKPLSVTSRVDMYAGSMPDGSPGATVSLYAYLYDRVTGTMYAGQSLTFAVDGTKVGTATTNSMGKATLSYTVPTGMSTGDHTITVSFAGNASYPAASGTGKLVVKARAVTAIYVRSYPLAVPGTQVPLYCYLYVKQGRVMLAGKQVTISVDGVDVATPQTDSQGYAAYLYTIPAGSGVHVVTVSFAGDAGNSAVSGTGLVTVP